MDSKKHTILNIRERKNKRIKSSFHNTALANSSNIPEWANQQFTFESEKQLLLPEKEETSAPVMNNDDGMLLDSFDFDSFLNADGIEFLDTYNLQRWINKKYPYLAQRNQLKELDLNDNEIYRYLSNHNELDLQEFTSLEKIYLAPWLASQITFKNKLEKTEVIRLINVREWVDSKYSTPEEKVWVRELYLNKPNLEGELDLSEFTYQDNFWGGCRVYISAQVEESKITFKNKPERVKIYLRHAQKAFDREFPAADVCLGELDPKNKGQTRNGIKKIDFSHQNLENSLTIKDFPQLAEINLGYNKFTSLAFFNCPQLKKVGCYGNNLTQLPIFSHSLTLRSLDISKNQLSNKLDLMAFKNLEEITCFDNQLTALNLVGLHKLARINCSLNQLSKLTLANCPNLTILNLQNNKFAALIINNCPDLKKIVAWNNQLTDLSVFSHLTNLEKLDIGKNKFTDSLAPLKNLTKLEELGINDNIQITGSLEPLVNCTSLKELVIKNTNISGSLEPLKNCAKLWMIEIENTDLTTGLEYLPKSLSRFECDGTPLVQELKFYNGSWKLWKEAWEKNNQESQAAQIRIPPNKKM